MSDSTSLYFDATLVSLWFHFDSTSIDIDVTSIPLWCPRFHFDVTSSLLRPHFEFTLVSLHFTSISLRFHFDFTSTSARLTWTHSHSPAPTRSHKGKANISWAKRKKESQPLYQKEICEMHGNCCCLRKRKVNHFHLNMPTLKTHVHEQELS